MKKAIILKKYVEGFAFRPFYRAIIKLTDCYENVSTMYYIDFNRTPDHGPEGMSIEITDYNKDNPNQFTHTADWREDGWTYYSTNDTEEDFEKCLLSFIEYHGAEFAVVKSDSERIVEVEEDLDILD